MKKLLIPVMFVVLIIVVFVLYENNYTSKIKNLVEDRFILVDEFYIYGRFFNIKGSIDTDESASLVFIDKKFVKTSYDLIVEDGKFCLSNEINGGLNLEKIVGNKYVILICIDGTYYSLKNNSQYDNAYYYSLSDGNYLKYLEFKFDEYKDFSCLKLESTVSSSKSVYDIVIDPGHGGFDPGAVTGNVHESTLNLSISLKLKKALEENGFRVLLTREDDSNPSPYGETGRATLPNKVKAKLFLSIHANSTPYAMKTGGVEIYAGPNMNYNFASSLALNIKESVNTTFSAQQTNKVLNGVYVRTFSQNDVVSSNNSAIKDGYIPYENLSTNTPWYFYNRETGGYMTGAYIDGRNTVYEKNPYWNSNMGVESYLVETGYITCRDDLNNLQYNQDLYVNGIVNAIVLNLK